MDKNGFGRVIYGGNVNHHLKLHIELIQRITAYPHRFITSDMIAQAEATHPDDPTAKTTLLEQLSNPDKLQGYVKTMRSTDSITDFFGTDLANQESDNYVLQKLASFWNTGRPPWIRMWTTIQMHKRDIDESGQVSEGDEVYRRTYMLGNQIFSDYGIDNIEGTLAAGDEESDQYQVRGKAHDNFYTQNPKLNSNPYESNTIEKQIGLSTAPRQEFGNNAFFSPSARIKTVTHTVKGARLGATSMTTITFDVWNKNDFRNIYQRYFLVPGAQLVIDIGASQIKPYDINEIVDLTNLNVNGPRQTGKLTDKIAAIRYGDGSLEGGISNFAGNAMLQNPAEMKVIMGTVTKFDAKVQRDRYECSITLVSKNRISFLSQVADKDDKLSEKFINKIDTFAIISTIEHILPQDKVKEIWSIDWLSNRRVDEIVALIGNTTLSSQYASTKTDFNLESREFYVKEGEGQTDANLQKQEIRHIVVADKAIPIVYIPHISQERGVYVQRLSYGYKDDKISTVTSTPSLKNNVFVSLQWIERELLNPLIQSELYDGTKQAEGGQFMTRESSITNVGKYLFRQQLYSNKIRHSLKFLYGSDCNNGGINDLHTPINETAIIPYLFVNCDVVKQALSAKTRIRDIYQYILDVMNEASLGLMDLTIGPTDEDATNFQVIDLNFDYEGVAFIEEQRLAKSLAEKDNTNEDEIYIDQESIFYNMKPILRPFTPGSIIQQMDFSFNVSNNKISNMAAIMGGGDNFRFSINNSSALKQFRINKKISEKDNGYGWKYLPNTSTTWESNAGADMDDYMNWHSHIPDIGNETSLFGRMRNYQGFTQQSNDFLVEQAKDAIENPDKAQFAYDEDSNAYDTLTEKEQEKLTDIVGKLQKDVIRQREKQWKVETSKVQYSVEEKDDGTGERWIYAKDFFDYYRLKQLKSMLKGVEEGEKKELPRYNPPITGMELSLTLTGMFGWKIGDSFRLDELPTEISEKVYFVVTGVTHDFANNLWKTRLKCSYRYRPGVTTGSTDEENQDYDYTETLITNTKIGISPTFLQTLGYTASTANEFSKLDESQDIVEALTPVSSAAEYKQELKTFKATKTSIKATQDLIDDDVSSDNQKAFTLNIDITPDAEQVDKIFNTIKTNILDNQRLKINAFDYDYNTSDRLGPGGTFESQYTNIGLLKTNIYEPRNSTFTTTNLAITDISSLNLNLNYENALSDPLLDDNVSLVRKKGIDDIMLFASNDTEFLTNYASKYNGQGAINWNVQSALDRQLYNSGLTDAGNLSNIYTDLGISPKSFNDLKNQYGGGLEFEAGIAEGGDLSNIPGVLDDFSKVNVYVLNDNKTDTLAIFQNVIASEAIGNPGQFQDPDLIYSNKNLLYSDIKDNFYTVDKKEKLYIGKERQMWEDINFTDQELIPELDSQFKDYIEKKGKDNNAEVVESVKKVKYVPRQADGGFDRQN